MGIITGGHLVVKVLESENVRHAFCVPGESYLGVMDGLYHHPSIRLVATRHEGGASFMAEAYAKISGKVGVCMATRGPGAANLSIGLHTAMQDSTPLVALIGQVERPFIGKEAFQEVDFASYFKPLCKWTVEIHDMERIPELLHQAFYKARSGRPGPVVVSLPHDMLEDTIDHPEIGSPLTFHQPIAAHLTIQKVLKEIEQAKRPIVIAGGGIIASESQQELARFAEKLHLPVVSAFRRFNVMDNHHPHYAGWLGFGANKKLIETIQTSDLVIALGTRLSQVTTQDYSTIGSSTKIIQIDISASSIGKAYPVDMGVVTDVKGFLQQANALTEQPSDEGKANFVKQMHQAYILHSTPGKITENTAFAEMNSIIRDLAEIIPEKSVITSDAGNFYGWLARYFRFTPTKKYIGPTSGAMGYGLPSALGVKAAYPDHTVISLSGDGGFMMTMQELETAVRANLPVIAIVVNNNMYGTIRAHQENHFPHRVIATSLTNPSFVEMARLYGCDGRTVSKNADFKPAFMEALHSKTLFVIEIQTDPAILSVTQAGRE